MNSDTVINAAIASTPIGPAKMWFTELIPLIQKMASGQGAPEDSAQIAQARDARADEILASQPGISRRKAVDAANAELTPALDHAESSTAGKKVDANAEAPGGPATDNEPINGTSYDNGMARQNELAGASATTQEEPDGDEAIDPQLIQLAMRAKKRPGAALAF